MSFYDELSKIDVDNIEDFAALISENARKHYLDVMVQKAIQLTRKRFGRCVNMYLPLYLTNLCSNKCAYCGFSVANKFKRVVLSLPEIEEELQAMNKLGYSNILLVSGENSHRAGMP